MYLQRSGNNRGEDEGRDVNKARGVKTKTKAKNAKVNCRENATVYLSILSHFRYSLEKLQ